MIKQIFEPHPIKAVAAANKSVRGVLVFNGEQITCPTNKSCPKLGDACHTLTNDTRNYLVENDATNGGGVLIRNSRHVMCGGLQNGRQPNGKQWEANIAEIIALDRAAYNQGQNAQFDIGIAEDGIAFTITAKGPGAICKTI